MSESEKLMMASGGEPELKEESDEKKLEAISDEEMKWIDALRTFKLNPGEGGPEELKKFLTHFNKKQEEFAAKTSSLADIDIKPVVKPKIKMETKYEHKPDIPLLNTGDASHTHTDLPTSFGNTYHFPKLSIFSGDGSKGEVTWEAYKYEIESLITEHSFSEEQLMLGIRRSLRGTAGDIIRRLGTGITVQETLIKLSSTYGSIESAESVMQKFYSCVQGNDSVLTYSTRLEDIYAQAIELQAIPKGSEKLLKQVLYQGLRMELKHIAQYKFDKVDDYDRFKIELRKFEAEIKIPDSKAKPCHSAQKIEGKNEVNELKDTVKLLQERLDQLEKQKESQPVTNNSFFPRNRLSRRPFGRTIGNPGRGRGQYQPSRPIAINTFRGLCNKCGKRGHFTRDCFSKYTTYSVTCYRCGEKGHFAKDCQVDYKDIKKDKNLKE